MVLEFLGANDNNVSDISFLSMSIDALNLICVIISAHVSNSVYILTQVPIWLSMA